jgi:hypothetical protein
MSTMPLVEEKTVAHPLTGWALLAGGALFLVGGSMHPDEDLPGAPMSEQLRVMYEDPAWYPAHVLLIAGTAFMTVSLIALVRGRGLSAFPRTHVTAVVAAIAGAFATVGMVLHLVSATEIDEIVARQSTPISDVHLIMDTVTVPAFGFSMAALAVVGAMTRTLGNRVTAVPGVIGGVGYGLAGGTAMFTPVFDFLFPTAAGIALWALAAGIGLLLRRRATRAIRG